MPRYRKKPVEVLVDAICWSGGNTAEVAAFLGIGRLKRGQTILIGNAASVMAARPGDWIIRDATGALYPIRPEVFEQAFEIVQ